MQTGTIFAGRLDTNKKKHYKVEMSSDYPEFLSGTDKETVDWPNLP